MRIADHKLQLQAWGISAVLHGFIASVAVMFLGQIKPLPLKDVFEWEVSLVQPAVREAKVEPRTPTSKPQPKATPPVEPVPQVVTRRVQTIEKPTVVERAIQPVVETGKPIETMVEPVERMATVQQRRAITTERQETKLVQVEERHVDRSVHAVGTPEPVIAAEARPIITQAPVMASVRPIETAAAVSPVHEEPIIRTNTVAAPSHDVGMPSPTVAAVEAPKAQERPSASMTGPTPSLMDAEPPVQVAKAAPQTAEVRADHRWVGESLWRRVAELKRYPSAARLNGMEGKVVLKAVIRADGHLAEVSVVKSSGHAVLDDAAMEAVKLACPLHMKHPIAAPQIVVRLPVVYSLTN